MEENIARIAAVHITHCASIQCAHKQVQRTFESVSSLHLFLANIHKTHTEKFHPVLLVLWQE